MKMFKGVFLLLLFLVAKSYVQPQIDLFPMPQEVILGDQVIPIANPCSILYQLQSPLPLPHQHISALLAHQQLKTFNCKTINFLTSPSPSPPLKLYNISHTVKIQIQNPSLQSVYEPNQQQYTLKITNSSSSISSRYYVGFVRGLETFLQTLSCSENNKGGCEIRGTPMVIIDLPQFSHRGIMIDSAKHYIPKRLILETIDGMMYNKMNVLHWCITDDDSFPLVLEGVPELAEGGAFSGEEVYTREDVREIVEYGLVRGVRIVPEISTPGRTASWIKSERYKTLKSSCERIIPGTGGFDIKDNNETMTLVRNVFKEVLEMFPDRMLHLGGQSQLSPCVNGGPSGLDYNLQYRQLQRQILQELDPSRTYIYYDSPVPVSNNDIVHYKGTDSSTSTNKVIYSHNTIHNLANGVGNKVGYYTPGYAVWMEIYLFNIPSSSIGAEMLLESETSNQYTHHIKIWMRSSSLAEKLWNGRSLDVKPNVLRRMTRHQRVMDRRGIPTAPITGQICEINPDFC